MGLELKPHCWHTGSLFPSLVCDNCGNTTALHSNMAQFPISCFTIEWRPPKLASKPLEETQPEGTVVVCCKCKYTWVINGRLKEACQKLVETNKKE